jgi:hypothetical protein
LGWFPYADDAEKDATTPREIDDPKASEADHIQALSQVLSERPFQFSYL